MSWNKIYEDLGDVETSSILPQEFLDILNNKNARTVLDAGCGTGRHSIHLKKLGFEVVALDSSKEALRILNEKNSDIKTIHGSLKSIPLDSFSFDAVICIKTMSHGTLQDIKTYVSELHRVLKQDGVLLTDFLSTKDEDFNLGKKIDSNTRIGLPGEEKIPHFFINKEKIKYLLPGFIIKSAIHKKVPASKFRHKKYGFIYQIIAQKTNIKNEPKI